MERAAGRTWEITVLNFEGQTVLLEVLLNEDPEVTPDGSLVIRERLTGAVARVWGPGRWLEYSREFTTTGRYEDDEIGNYPHGKVIG
jgi:hypothetical protein